MKYSHFSFSRQMVVGNNFLCLFPYTFFIPRDLTPCTRDIISNKLKYTFPANVSPQFQYFCLYGFCEDFLYLFICKNSIHQVFKKSRDCNFFQIFTKHFALVCLINRWNVFKRCDLMLTLIYTSMSFPFKSLPFICFGFKLFSGITQGTNILTNSKKS